MAAVADSSAPERRVSPLILRVDVRAVLDQDLNCQQIALPRCVLEGGKVSSVRVCLIDTCATTQQERHEISRSSLSRRNQQRREAAISVSLQINVRETHRRLSERKQVTTSESLTGLSVQLVLTIRLINNLGSLVAKIAA